MESVLGLLAVSLKAAVMCQCTKLYSEVVSTFAWRVTGLCFQLQTQIHFWAEASNCMQSVCDNRMISCDRLQNEKSVAVYAHAKSLKTEIQINYLDSESSRNS